MRTNTCKGLLLDAAAAISAGRYGLALHFLATAERIARFDDAIATRVHDLIVDAREAMQDKLAAAA